VPTPRRARLPKASSKRGGCSTRPT
jgi:hypothetical protein